MATQMVRQHTHDPREVMNIEQAAHYLGISRDTLYKYASEGTIPAFKLGNRWRFRRAVINKWMDMGGTDQKMIRATV